MKHNIKDIKLAAAGKQKIEWASREMGVLAALEKRFQKEKPLRGVRIAACLHVTSETARLMQVLKSAGANVALCASNPLSTKDDVAASLVKHDKIAVFAAHGANRALYYKHLEGALAIKPHITMDDGADLAALLHGKYKALVKDMYGSTEETTTGVIRLRSLEKSGSLRLPVVAVNAALTKHLFDNRYGTGQSTIDGILRATNILLAGRTFVVAGYGWCGKGVAMRAKGLGSRVLVAEVDPIRALEAAMDGFAVLPMLKAAAIADVIVTVTGDCAVIGPRVIAALKDGCILANAGHFDVEINLPALAAAAKKIYAARPNVRSYELSGRRTVHVLAAGRLVNLAAAEGHPAAVMDLSFAGQALAAVYLRRSGKKLSNQVYALPEALDKEIAAIKLKSLGLNIDRLTPRQQQYLTSWQEGT